MKHVICFLFQNTNTVIFIEKSFYKHNLVHFFIHAPKARLLCNLVGSVGLIVSGVDGGAFSLSSSSSNTMGFSTDPCPINKSSNVVGEKGVSMPGLNIRSTCEFSQLNSISSRSVN